jgi:hypothetical protein
MTAASACCVARRCTFTAGECLSAGAVALEQLQELAGDEHDENSHQAQTYHWATVRPSATCGSSNVIQVEHNFERRW